MNRDRRSQQCLLAGVAFGTLALGTPAVAADMALKAPAYRAVYDWTGFYIGAHTGYSRGSSNAVLTDPAIAATGNGFANTLQGFAGGWAGQRQHSLATMH